MTVGGSAGDAPSPGAGGATTAPTTTAPPTPQPVVTTTDCGPADPAASNRVEGDCRAALLQCPPQAGVPVNPNIHVVETVTTYPDGTRDRTVNCAVQTGPVVTGADIRDWVSKHIPVGSVGTPAAKSLVNITTPYWLDAKPEYDWGPLTIIQTGVRIRVSLVSIDWAFGDGATATTTDPGAPYDPVHPCDAACTGHFGHTYRSAGAMTVTARASWTAEFSIDGGAFVALPQQVLADPAAPATVDLLQAHSRLLGGR